MGGGQPLQGRGVPAGAWAALPGEQLSPAAERRVLERRRALAAAAAAAVQAARNGAARQLPGVDGLDPLALLAHLLPGRERGCAGQPAEQAEQLLGPPALNAFQHPREAMLAALRQRNAPAQAQVPAGQPAGHQPGQPALDPAAAAVPAGQRERIARMQPRAQARAQAHAYARAHPAQPAGQAGAAPVPAQQPARQLLAGRYSPVPPPAVPAHWTAAERLAFHEAMGEIDALPVYNRAAPAPAPQAAANRPRARPMRVARPR